MALLRFMKSDLNELLWDPLQSQTAAEAIFFANYGVREAGTGCSLLEHSAFPTLARCEMDRSAPTLQVGSKTLTVEDGHEDLTVNIQRIGPFTTHGNYSWTEVYYRDALQTRELFHETKKLRIRNAFLGPVDGRGLPIIAPPLSIHHGRLNPGWGQPIYHGYPFTTQSCLFHRLCPDNTVFMAIARDYVCPEAEGGTDCLVSPVMTIFAKPLSLNLQVNDVRPPNSENLTWFIQGAIELLLDEQHVDTWMPQSRFYFTGVSPSWVPSGDSIQVQMAMLPFSGSIVNFSYHVFHNHAFYNYEAADTSADIFEEGLLLKGSSRTSVPRWNDVELAFESGGTFQVPSLKVFRAQISEDAVICDSFVRYEGGSQRKSATRCSTWRFARGDTVTQVAMLRNNHLTTKKIVTYHHQWAIWYEADDGHPHFTTQRSSSTEPNDCVAFFFADLSAEDMLLLALKDNEDLLSFALGGLLVLALFHAFCFVRRAQVVSTVSSAISCLIVTLCSVRVELTLVHGLINRDKPVEWLLGDEAVRSCARGSSTPRYVGWLMTLPVLPWAIMCAALWIKFRRNVYGTRAGGIGPPHANTLV